MSAFSVLLTAIVVALGLGAYRVWGWLRGRANGVDLGGVSEQWLAQNRGHSSRHAR